MEVSIFTLVSKKLKYRPIHPENKDNLSSKIILNDQNPHFKAVIIVKKAFVLFFIQFIAAVFFYSCKGYSYCDSEPFSLLYQYPGFFCGDSASGEGVRLYCFNITTATAKAVFVDLLQFQYIEEVVIDAVNNHYSANFMEMSLLLYTWTSVALV